MRTKIFFILSLLFLLVLPISKASYVKTCESVSIEVNLEALDEKGVISRYQNPEYREGDILIIKNINIFNDGNCNVTPLIKFTLIDDREEKQEDFNNYYYRIRPNIKINESYSLNFIVYDKDKGFIYKDSNNTNKSINGKYIKPAGVWKFNVSTSVPNLAISVNKEYINPNIRPYVFRVYTVNDLELRELAKETNELGKISNKLSNRSINIVVFFGIFTIVITVFLPYLSHIRNQENLLQVLLLDLAKIAKASESYKDVFVQNILKHKDFYSKDGEVKHLLEKYFNKYLQLLDKKNQRIIKNKKGDFKLVEEIQELLEKDKKISENIKLFCEVIINKIHNSKYDEFLIDNSKFVLQFFLIRQVDNNFYSKQLDSKIKNFETIDLKNLLMNLSADIDVINYQVAYLNDKYMDFRADYTEGMIRWNIFYYLTFSNIWALDKKIIYVLQELLKYDKINIKFKNLVNTYRKLKENKEEISEIKIRDIGALNIMYSR